MRHKNYQDEGVARAEWHARKGVPREPLKTLAELAEEIGVSSKKLGSLIHHRNGPTPVVRHSLNRIAYYSPSAMRKWWVGINSSNC